MDLYNALALLLVTATGFAYINHRFLKMPPAIVLMVLGLVASLVLVVLAARWLAVLVPMMFLRFIPSFQPSDHGVAVLTWGGLRGGLSVALALSLPATMPRELIVGITYVIVVFSIVGQGLTIGPLVHWLGVGQPSNPEQ